MPAVTFHTNGKDTFACYYQLIKEQEGPGYSAICLNLPGCCGQGVSPEMARDDIAASFLALLESYRDDGVEVPFNGYSGKVGDKVVAVKLSPAPAYQPGTKGE